MKSLSLFYVYVNYLNRLHGRRNINSLIPLYSSRIIELGDNILDLLVSNTGVFLTMLAGHGIHVKVVQWKMGNSFETISNQKATISQRDSGNEFKEV